MGGRLLPKDGLLRRGACRILRVLTEAGKDRTKPLRIGAYPLGGGEDTVVPILRSAPFPPSDSNIGLPPPQQMRPPHPSPVMQRGGRTRCLLKGAGEGWGGGIGCLRSPA